MCYTTSAFVSNAREISALNPEAPAYFFSRGSALLSLLSFYSYLVLLLILLFRLYLAIHNCCLQKPASLSTSYASKLKQTWCISVLEQVHVEANQHFCWKGNSWFYRRHLNTHGFRPTLHVSDETSKQTVPAKSTAYYLPPFCLMLGGSNWRD